MQGGAWGSVRGAGAGMCRQRVQGQGLQLCCAVQPVGHALLCSLLNTPHVPHASCAAPKPTGMPPLCAHSLVWDCRRAGGIANLLNDVSR